MLILELDVLSYSIVHDYLSVYVTFYCLCLFQAHVRGHQVRKHYKMIVWSVGIVEKVILRWRRKRPGLRGFRIDRAIGGAEEEDEKADEYDFLHVGRKQKAAGFEKALARVKSMVRHPEAREQYRRLMDRSSKSKVNFFCLSISVLSC